MAVDGGLLFGSGELGNFLLGLCGGCCKKNICLLRFMLLAGKFKRKHRENEVQHDNGTIHEFYDNRATGIKQSCIYGESIFQNVVYRR